MGGWTAIVIVLASIGSAAVALAHERDLACREPSVVDEMKREIRSQNYYSQVDPRLVTEQPTTDPSVVRCQVWVRSAPHDTTRFDDRAIAQRAAHVFEVKILPTGFVVRDLR